MTEHAPLMEKLAVKPALVSFSLDELVVRCPKCRATRTFRLRHGPPDQGACCPSCGQPWRWK